MALLSVLLFGCSTPTDPAAHARREPLGTEEPGSAEPAIVGIYANPPRNPRVEVEIFPDGAWTANVYPFPGFVCQGVQYKVTQPMYFHGTGAVDTTAHMQGLWAGGVTDYWQAYGYLEADYRQSWAARDTVLVGVIEGRWVMSVYGECQAAHQGRFWLKKLTSPGEPAAFIDNLLPGGVMASCYLIGEVQPVHGRRAGAQ